MKMHLRSGSTLLLLVLAAQAGLAQTNLKITAPTANVSGSENVTLGVGAGPKNTGSNNVFTGFRSGASNTIGNFNSFFGHSAGQQNTTGSRNTFVGDGAGFANNGSSNTFVGGNAGQNNTTGFRNVYIGNAAGLSGSENSKSVFIGFEAGSETRGGNGSVFIGSGAGRNSNGLDNVCIGQEAGANNAASNNIFLGTRAGFGNKTGSRNTFVGERSGFQNEGSFNTFLGFQAGTVNTTGSNNTFLGSHAGENNQIGTSNVFLGANAGLFNINGNGNLFIGQDAGFFNFNGSDNVFLGWEAARSNTSGAGNVAIGKGAGLTNATGKGNTFVGNLANAASDKLSNATALGNRALVTVSNAVVIGSVNGRNGATANAKVGIGTTAPTHQLQLSTDDAAKPGTSSWKVASDKRLKKDIKDFTDGLEVLKKVNPVWFRYTGEAGMPTDKKYVGVVAQEMQKIAGYTIDTFTHQDSTGKATHYLNYDATALTYILVNAVKELKAEKDDQIDALRQQNEALQKELAQLRQLLTRTERVAPAARTGTQPATGVAGAQLWQNEPNPADGTTVIRYALPPGTRRASLRVFDRYGREMKSFPLDGSSQGQVTLSTAGWPAGTYPYHLVVDGKNAGSSQLVLLH